MERVFLEVLNNSIVCGWVILCVLLIRFLISRVTKIDITLLWTLVVIRLLLPVGWSKVPNYFSLLPFRTRPIPQGILYAQTPQITSGIGTVDRAVNAVLPAPNPIASVNPMQVLAAVGALIWIVGMALMLVWGIVSMMRLRRSLRDATELERGVFQAENLKTPFVLGIFRPRIYLPAGLTEEEKTLVLAHEQTHVRQKHPLLKSVAYLALCIHWFNPVVWLAFRKISEDFEMCCDELALLKLGEENRKAYSALLLSLSSERKLPGGPLAFGESDVKKRIKRLLKRKPPVILSFIALGVVVLACAGLSQMPEDLEENIRWLQSLQTADVTELTLEITGAEDGQEYRKYTEEEFPEILRFLNKAQGAPLRRSQEYTGNDQIFRIRTADDRMHIVANLENRCLSIDGAYYEATDWLRQWDFAGDRPMPQSLGLSAYAPEPEGEIMFAARETDLLNIGMRGVTAYFEAMKNAPADKRVASAIVRQISLLAGNENEFCVSVNYEFTSADAAYDNPAQNLSGIGTWEDCYLELRMARVHPDGDNYLVKQVGINGVAQGLEAKTMTPALAEELARKPGKIVWEDLRGFVCTEDMRKNVYGRIYPISGTPCILSATGASLEGVPIYIRLDNWAQGEEASLDLQEARPEEVTAYLEEPLKARVTTDPDDKLRLMRNLAASGVLDPELYGAINPSRQGAPLEIYCVNESLVRQSVERLFVNAEITYLPCQYSRAQLAALYQELSREPLLQKEGVKLSAPPETPALVISLVNCTPETEEQVLDYREKRADADAIQIVMT